MGGNLQVQVTDANVLPATLTNVVDASGAVVGQELVTASVSSDTYFLHVLGDSDAGTDYTLTVATLTADLVTQVEGSTTDTVAAGAVNEYRLAAGLTGSLQVTLTGDADVQGGVNLTIYGADGITILASDPANGVGAGQSEQLSISITAGQVVFPRRYRETT